MNLIGDGIHNFIDGIVIAGAYMVNVTLGIAATISVIFHEIPQEIADFGVLLYGGLTRKKAVIFNLLSAATAILGGTCVMILSIFSGGIIPTISNYHEAYKNMEDRAVERINTNINIENMTNTSGFYYDLNITVKNTGHITLKTLDFTILINGIIEQ